MKLAAKLALGAGVVAVGVCGVLAFIAADDERRDFVRGSTRSTALPVDVLVVEAECVDDEYEDTDDETDRVAQVAPTMAVIKRGEEAMAGHPKAKTKIPSGPETVDDDTEEQADVSKCSTQQKQTRVATRYSRTVDAWA